MKRVETICESWEGTRYMRGQCRRGAGVDCFRFVGAVLAELEGKEQPELPRVASDIGYHDEAGSRRAAAALLRLFAPVVDVDPADGIEAGDLVLGRSVGGGPAHAFIVGGRPGLWHAHHPRVMRSGLSISEFRLEVDRVYRMGDRTERLLRGALS